MIETEAAVFCKLRGKHVIRAATMYAVFDADAKCVVCAAWHVDGLEWIIEAEDGTRIT